MVVAFDSRVSGRDFGLCRQPGGMFRTHSSWKVVVQGGQSAGHGRGLYRNHTLNSLIIFLIMLRIVPIQQPFVGPHAHLAHAERSHASELV